MSKYGRELSESYLFRYLAAESKRLLGFSAGRLSV
jgi:hypothetical protein